MAIQQPVKSGVKKCATAFCNVGQSNAIPASRLLLHLLGHLPGPRHDASVESDHGCALRTAEVCCNSSQTLDERCSAFCRKSTATKKSAAALKAKRPTLKSTKRPTAPGTGKAAARNSTDPPEIETSLRGVLRSDVMGILAASGDVQPILPETVDAVEGIAIEFMSSVIAQVMEVVRSRCTSSCAALCVAQQMQAPMSNRRRAA